MSELLRVEEPLDELAALVRQAVRQVRLDLSGRVVLTEAATGPYVVTPVLAALAGAAEVRAWTRAGRYGSEDDVRAQTAALAEACGVADRIVVSTRRSFDDVRRADIVTNSGHVRPIDAAFVAAMKPGAVVPLMFEAWEIEAGRFDVDLAALRRRGIAVAGTNERHPNVGVFDWLAPMAALALRQAGVPVPGSRLAVLCDNPFSPYLTDGLTAAGARSVVAAKRLAALPAGDRPWDTAAPSAVVVSLRPNGGSVLAEPDVAELAARWPGVPVVQFWGDLDRTALAAAGVPVWPSVAPPAGHMAVLPSAVGPEPVVRLQCGGLKVAEVLLTPPSRRRPDDVEYVDEL